MNDKELADKVVALGIDGLTYVTHGVYCPADVSSFVRDWRVAGALMERLPAASYYHLHMTGGQWDAEAEPMAGGLRKARNDSLPRAIIEACVAAAVMSETQRYHFYRKKPGQPLKFWSNRMDKDGSMAQFIEDLRTRYDVTTEDGRTYVISDKP